MSIPRVVIVSGNPAKSAAIKRVAALLGLRCVERVRVDVPEQGATFVENAAAKAVAGSLVRSGALALASDGGLELPDLGSRWQPLRTSRFAGDVVPAAKVAALFALMSGVDRRARWIESLAVAQDGEVLAAWTESGPWSRLVERPRYTGSPFWLDALLEVSEPGPSHWDLLTFRFSEFVASRLWVA